MLDISAQPDDTTPPPLFSTKDTKKYTPGHTYANVTYAIVTFFDLVETDIIRCSSAKVTPTGVLQGATS
jgi:hypothetical protein